MYIVYGQQLCAIIITLFCQNTDQTSKFSKDNRSNHQNPKGDSEELNLSIHVNFTKRILYLHNVYNTFSAVSVSCILTELNQTGRSKTYNPQDLKQNFAQSLHIPRLPKRK
ncbi:solute carrier organic anion transporter family member 1C1 [Striga asiatica]|uniref:Solute carrier organic anion transporter family member 1C1 n=1 Tax=Striga asiatica TaxID=4170 RepID=A0A5A7PVI9_STRAF|nr:solute carrier organic anion transporter family member 1C1 [Striga asiatica]